MKTSRRDLPLSARTALVRSRRGALGEARADVITDWNATTQAVLVAKAHQGPPGYALVHVAMYDAVNAVDGRYSVFAVRPTSSGNGASKEAAAATAAYRVLISVYPDQAALLDPAYAASLAAVPNGSAKTKGIAIGTEVATAWLAIRANDGREAAVPYVFDPAPAAGVYQRTPPGPERGRPMAREDAAVRDDEPVAVSRVWAAGPHERALRPRPCDGAGARLRRTAPSARQRRRRPGGSTRKARRPSSRTTCASSRRRKSLGVSGNARLFAQVFVTAADSMIACWDSKYYFNFWRPVTAITTDLDDGNPATERRTAAWTPLAPTPGHPEYPAGHGCVSTGYAEALRYFFGTSHVKVTLTSSVAGSVPHVFHDTDGLIDEIILARVFGGMHFPTSVEHGSTIGKKVGRLVAKNHFRPVKCNERFRSGSSRPAETPVDFLLTPREARDQIACDRTTEKDGVLLMGRGVRGLWSIAVALGAHTALAHHSPVMFDQAQPVMLTGTVREFQWTNPHSYIQLIVKNDQGRTRNGASKWARRSISITSVGARGV